VAGRGLIDFFVEFLKERVQSGGQFVVTNAIILRFELLPYAVFDERPIAPLVRRVL
jgi:hypothetical protein